MLKRDDLPPRNKGATIKEGGKERKKERKKEIKEERRGEKRKKYRTSCVRKKRKRVGGRERESERGGGSLCGATLRTIN
jgi:hypothetical protein